MVLWHVSAQLTIGFKIVIFLMNSKIKILFIANKYFSRYKHFCVALKSY